jgi:hypothetical protein
VERTGEIRAGNILDKLQEDITEYYGQKNEIKVGVRTIPPQKPDILVVYDTCRTQRLPLLAGGLMDQPHFWLMQYEVIEQTIERLRSQKLIME